MDLENRKVAADARQYQREIRRRLNEFRRKFPQSEIARRTHTPLTNVHRYMHEGKIPAEFCTALVEAFGVNPAWLLLGEGSTLLSEVSAQSAQTGQGLLTLVENMNAVSRLRLGALTGKLNLKVLRELSDAFGTFERLREKLNAQSTPAFASLLGDLARHLNELDLDRAQGACAAAREVSRLCDDEELHTRFAALQSDFEYARGQLESSLDYSRRVFSRLLRRGAIREDGELRNVVNLVMSLKDTGRYREALRTAIAALALAQDHGHSWESYLELELFRGHLETELGWPREGLARIQRVWPKVNMQSAQSAGLACVVYHRALLLCDLISPTAARALGTPGPGVSRQLLRWACWLENPHILRDCVTTLIGEDGGRLALAEYESQRAKLVLRALEGRTRYAEFERMNSEHPPAVASAPVRELVLCAHATQFARLCRDKVRATTQLTRFEELSSKLQEGIFVNLDVLALHHRDALLLASAPADARRSAEQFFRGRLAEGYACFADVVPAMAP